MPIRNRCVHCGYLLSIRGGNHSEEFCAEMREFPLMSYLSQSSRYALASAKSTMVMQNKRNAAVMHTIANAPVRVGIPVNTLNPIRPDKVERYLPTRKMAFDNEENERILWFGTSDNPIL